MPKSVLYSSKEALQKIQQREISNAAFDDEYSHRMKKDIDTKMNDFDLQKSQKVVRSIEDLSKTYITH